MVLDRSRPRVRASAPSGKVVPARGPVTATSFADMAGKVRFEESLSDRIDYRVVRKDTSAPVFNGLRVFPTTARDLLSLLGTQPRKGQGDTTMSARKTRVATTEDLPENAPVAMPSK